MMNRGYCSVVVALLCLALLFLSARGALCGCEQEAEAYVRACAPGVSIDEKIALLAPAVGTCRSFALSFELARAYYAKGDPEKAMDVLEDAKSLAASPAEKKNGFLALARMCALLHEQEKALLYYRGALSQLPEGDMAVEKEMMDVERTLPARLTAKAITAFLEDGLGNRSFGVRPAIDLRVNFSFDSTSLTDEGKAQVEELGRALGSPELKGHSFILIGHTDVRGTDRHNDTLSLERAQAVKAYLSRSQGISPEILDVKAMGKREPLYHENTEAAHAMNRRVEVEVR
jgi:outer membrane protein OmpA-like peptidoglycan-associated protein